MSKGNITYFVIFAIGLITMTCWVFWFEPELKSDFSFYSGLREYEGKDSYVKSIGDELSEPVLSRDILEYEIVNETRNTFEIESNFITYNIMTGEKIYENKNHYYINKNTKKHINNGEYYFKFPYNTQKQNYQLIDPTMEVPATFVFEGIKYVDDLEVYEFSCKSFGDDFSDAFPQFSPEKIFGDQTCTTLIEPITGKTIAYTLTWNMYAIQDGKPLSVEKGQSKTTEFTERIMLQSAKNTKQLFYFYDFVIPVFLSIFFVSVFFIHRYNKKSRDEEKIIIKQLQEIKEANQSKIELLEKQSKYEKLAIIGELSARLAHDLRNPLNVIKIGIELVATQYDEKFNDDTRARIQIIKRAINRISHQVDDVLDFVRTKPMKIESVSLNSILSRVLESVSIPQGIKITRPESDLFVSADSHQIETVFSNLISNSIQSLGETGEIKIRFEENSNQVMIQVIDSGPGIAEDKFDKIFEPLFTTKQIGTGLGLASCKTIIENHGGTISVKNNPTTFTITLPRTRVANA